MKLLITNDQDESFEYHCDTFEAYDAFTEANFHWGPHAWETFTVKHGVTVLMNVINPTVLDANASQVLQ